MINSFIQRLHHTFALKDLGPVFYFLGVEVIRQTDGMYLNQSHYIRKLLDRTNMSDCKPSLSPASSTVQLRKENRNPMSDPRLYRSTIGALQYLSLTRLDISFIVNKLSQFMQHPLDTHWAACKRVLRYLKATATHRIHLRASSHNRLQGFSNADWASNVNDHRSTGGHCIYLGDNLVTWSTKKQQVVTRSSTESEYCALANCAADLN